MTEEKETGFRVVDRRKSLGVSDGTSSDTEVKQEQEKKTEQQNAGSFEENAFYKHHQMDFSSFIFSLANQAMMMMGAIPNPETKLVSMDLGLARQAIDIIGLLEEKTKGNLTEQEVTLISDILASLRMAFVEKVKKG